MEQTASKTEADSLEDKESLYLSPPDLNGISPQDPDYYPPGAEDQVIDVKSEEHLGNLRAKKYSRITDEQRRDFINAVENDGEKIIHAAKRFDINYSSAKSILNVFKSQGRSIKKQFRDKPNKNLKYNSEGSEGSLANNSATGDKLTMGDKVPTKSNASTQTVEDPDQEENSLLALRDRLLASKTDKRQNPYEGLSSHEFTRFSGSLNDYSENQLAADPGSRGSVQVFNLNGNSNQSFMSQQNMARPDSLGYGNAPQNYQFYQQGGPNMMQNSPSMYQQPQFIQGGQSKPPNNQSQWSGSDFSKAGNLEGPPRQQEGQNYSSMIYTGVNQVQYLMMDPTNGQIRGMQMNQQQQQQQQQQQYQFLQPVMYVMPTPQNVSNMNQQPFMIPQQNNPIMYNPNQNNNSGGGSGQNQNGGGGGQNFNNNPYSNLK